MSLCRQDITACGPSTSYGQGPSRARGLECITRRSAAHARPRGAAFASAAAAPAPQQRPAPAAALASFVGNNFIPLGLLASIVIGWTSPSLGLAAAEKRLQPVATIGMFVISGLILEQGEALAAVRSRVAVAYGLAAILLATPLAALVALHLPLQPPQLALGLATFCCVPTTLSACVALTQAAGGNAAMALLLTVSTNLLGVFTIPVLLPLLLGASAGGARLEPAPLFKNLVLTVLLPLLSGMVLQSVVPGLREWRTRNRRLLSYVSTCFLCLVPWMEVSKASSAQLPLTAGALGATALGALGLHLVYLAGNTAATSLLTFDADASRDTAIRKAVVLATSQKTLPIAIAVLAQISGPLGAGAGFAVVACVLAHLTQTVFDSLLVGAWNRRNMRLKSAA